MRELHDCCSFDNVIGVATHRSGVAFLRNFLASLRDYAAYPIVVVINDFKDDDRQLFEGILNEFARLPIHVATLRENYGEFGVLAAMDRIARCDNIFLLSHSCEIKDPKLFEIVFKDLPHESSVALSYLPLLKVRSYRDFAEADVLTIYSIELQNEGAQNDKSMKSKLDQLSRGLTVFE